MTASDWLYLVGGIGAAGAVTYLSCIRPMLQYTEHCAMRTATPGICSGASTERDTQAEIAALRRERAALRAALPPGAVNDYQDTKPQ